MIGPGLTTLDAMGKNRVTGGHRFKSALQKHAKQFTRNTAVVGWDGRDPEALMRAWRNEYGAEGPGGVETVSERAFIRKAIVQYRKPIAQAMAAGARRGDPDGGLRAAADALRKGIQRSARETGAYRTGRMSRGVRAWLEPKG